MTKSAMVVRKCHNLDELSACVALQKEVWNFAEAELVPLRVFVVAEKIGGQVIGAFDDGQLVAFALSLPGSRGGHSYLRRCLQCGTNIATPGWAGKSNCSKGRMLSYGDSN